MWPSGDCWWWSSWRSRASSSSCPADWKAPCPAALRQRIEHHGHYRAFAAEGSSTLTSAPNRPAHVGSIRAPTQDAIAPRDLLRRDGLDRLAIQAQTRNQPRAVVAILGQDWPI